MADDQARTQYRTQLAQRMKRLRKKSGRAQAAMARVLLANLDQYKKWEQRGALPMDRVEMFAVACGVTAEYVLTGQDSAPAQADQEAPARQRSRAASR